MKKGVVTALALYGLYEIAHRVIYKLAQSVSNGNDYSLPRGI